MNDTNCQPNNHYMLYCALIMTALAALVFYWWGFNLISAIAIVVLLACPVAMVMAWLAARRSFREIDSAVPRNARK